MLEILACPACKNSLALKTNEPGQKGFFCERCKVIYPIRDDIPVMLVEEAIPEEKWEKGDEKCAQ